MTQREFIEIHRIKLGLSKGELALKMGVSSVTLSNWLKGKKMPLYAKEYLRLLIIEKEYMSLIQNNNLKEDK
jgi:DNA-binding transcriptional regulator YiaG